MNKERKNQIFRIDPEYYTFVSGALISIPLTLLFELSSNYREVVYWLGLLFSFISSFFCFKLSLLLKNVHEKYISNMKGVGDTAKAWNSAINKVNSKLIIYLIIIVVSLILSIIFVFLMQFTDSSTLIVLDEAYICK